MIASPNASKIIWTTWDDDGLPTTFWYNKPAHLPFTSYIAIWAEIPNIFQSGSI